MQFLGMSPSHKMSFTWKVPQVWCLFPVWKQEKRQHLKQGWWRRFQTNPNVDGWGARKCNLQFASPRIPMSMVTTYIAYSCLFQFWDAQQGCTTVWTPSTWCLNTKHVMGWDENANPLSGQSKCLENQLFILFQHFAGYTMVILCWRSTGRINKHFTMVYHLWRPQSQCFENPFKTNVDLLFGGWFFSTDGQQVFLGSSIPTTPRCNGSFGHSAEPQRPRCFFMAPTRLWCLGQGIRGCTRYSSGKKIWWARIN